MDIFISGESMIVVACYRPPNMPTITDDAWLRFFTQFGQSKVIFEGDLNAHNPMWGSSHLCPNGRAIGKAISDSDLSILGDNSPTFCEDTFRNPSIVDLTLVHNSLYPRYTRKVELDPWDSDHFPIFIEYARLADFTNLKKK